MFRFFIIILTLFQLVQTSRSLRKNPALKDPLYLDYHPKQDLFTGWMFVNKYSSEDTLCLMMGTRKTQFFLLTTDSLGNKEMIRGNWDYSGYGFDITTNGPGYIRLHPWGDIRGWSIQVYIKDSLWYDQTSKRHGTERTLVLDTIYKSLGFSSSPEALQASKIWLAKVKEKFERWPYLANEAEKKEFSKIKLDSLAGVLLNSKHHPIRFERVVSYLSR